MKIERVARIIKHSAGWIKIVTLFCCAFFLPEWFLEYTRPNLKPVASHHRTVLKHAHLEKPNIEKQHQTIVRC